MVIGLTIHRALLGEHDVKVACATFGPGAPLSRV